MTLNSILRRLLNYSEKGAPSKNLSLKTTALVLMSESFNLITSLDLSQLRATTLYDHKVYELQIMNKLKRDNRQTYF